MTFRPREGRSFHSHARAKTGPFQVLSKSNGRLQATWNSKAASY